MAGSLGVGRPDPLIHGLYKGGTEVAFLGEERFRLSHQGGHRDKLFRRAGAEQSEDIPSAMRSSTRALRRYPS